MKLCTPTTLPSLATPLSPLTATPEAIFPLHPWDIHQIQEWWSQFLKLGPGYGYFPNAVKTWLITKDKLLSRAQTTFEGTGIQITTRGLPYLGAPIGCSEYVESIVRDQVDQWLSLRCIKARVENKSSFP